MMKRTCAAIVIVSLVSSPLAAQDLRVRPSFLPQGTSAPTQTPPPRPPAPAPAASQGDHAPLAVTLTYGASLGLAIGGTAFLVNQSRRALDHHLDVRTFPLVWVRSTDPKDKGRVTATLWASNAVIMFGSFLAFRHRQYKAAILLNAFVATLTFVAGVRERNTIDGK